MGTAISEGLIARLSNAAAQRNMDAEELLIALLDAEEKADAQDFEESCAAIAEGYAELEAKQGRTLEEYAAHSHARQSLRSVIRPPSTA